MNHLPAILRRAAPPAILVVLTAIALVVLGSSAAHAVMLAAAGLSALLLWHSAEYTADGTWPQVPPLHRDGARRDVSDLGWAILGKDGRVTDRAARRVRTLADHQLARHGLHGDLADPHVATRAEPLLGTPTAHGLHDHATHGTLPTPRQLQTWLDAVERLATTPPPDEGTPR
ncbi:hypothetical protein [Cellulosimicrobium sp. Marseille-Q4280]|jgi:hypothetical protein|uniref:hypothetical protein n=1 Tax=Cellulosimicrobium sp. Marseille-Q4280 TaxID=2937992 RepID=UPI00203B522A|nr:hypothetical protein [Cellulosimicrobium sp. Marseille-Q4280]